MANRKIAQLPSIPVLPGSYLVAADDPAGAADAVKVTINDLKATFIQQTAHGFTVAMAVHKDNTGTWVRSQGNVTGHNSFVTGVIAGVIDANNFKLAKPGDIIDITGLGLSLAADTVYYLSNTGTGVNYTPTAPSNVGDIYKELFVTGNANEIQILNSPSYQITAPSSGGSGVTSISLATENVVYNTPSNFTNASGAWTAALTLKTQVKNLVFAGPYSGANAAPTWRLLGPADLGTGTANATTVLYGDGTYKSAPGSQVLTFGSFSGANSTVLDIGAYYNLYDIIEIELVNVQFANTVAGTAQIAKLRVSPDGTTFGSGSTSYAYGFVWNYGNGNAPVNSYVQDGFYLSDRVGNTAFSAAGGLNGKIVITNPGVATLFPSIRWAINYYSQQGVGVFNEGGGSYLTTAQVTKAIQLISDATTISGKYIISGRKAS